MKYQIHWDPQIYRLWTIWNKSFAVIVLPTLMSLAFVCEFVMVGLYWGSEYCSISMCNVYNCYTCIYPFGCYRAQIPCPSWNSSIRYTIMFQLHCDRLNHLAYMGFGTAKSGCSSSGWSCNNATKLRKRCCCRRYWIRHGLSGCSVSLHRFVCYQSSCANTAVRCGHSNLCELDFSEKRKILKTINWLW